MASTVTAESRALSAEYVMPPIHRGVTVFWYPDNKRSTSPHIAVVTHVDQRSLQLTLLPTGIRQLSVRDGVRHVDDPKTKEMEMVRTGCWDYTDDAKEWDAFRRKIEGILSRPSSRPVDPPKE